MYYLIGTYICTIIWLINDLLVSRMNTRRPVHPVLTYTPTRKCKEIRISTQKLIVRKMINGSYKRNTRIKLNQLMIKIESIDVYKKWRNL